MLIGIILALFIAGVAAAAWSSGISNTSWTEIKEILKSEEQE